MDTVYMSINQLDLAANQLHLPEPDFSRFALILVDNIVELMLHRKCEDEIVRDDGYFSYGKQFGGAHQFNAKTRAKALGRHFDEKPKFCRRIGILSSDEDDFVRTMHGYRNTVYHVGIRDNNFLLPLAWQYHEFACGLFERLYPIIRVWRVGQTIPEIAVNHAGPNGITTDSYDEDIARTASSLKAAKPPLPHSFSTMLSEAAVERVERFDGLLYFLSNDGGMTEETALNEIQFRDHVFKEDSEYLDQVEQIQNHDEWEAFVRKVRESWRPRFAISPVSRWLNRAENLRSETNPLLVLKKFRTLLNEMEPMIKVASEAADELENHIQLQIDIARGK